jgi:hypothetical protein
MSEKRVLILHSPSLEVKSSNANEVYLSVTNTSADFKSKVETVVGVFDEVKCMSGCIPDEDVQADIYEFMASGSKLLIEEIKSREAGQALALDLKIAGFVDIMVAMDPSTNERFIVCQKPQKSVANVAPVKLAIAGITTSGGAPEVKKWKMNTVDLADDDLLIDEMELVDDIVVPEPGCGPDAFEAGKKRACANCSCGLKEIEATEAETGIKSTVDIPKSSCGSCYKGDAYRCASCPFLGKPAFQAGSEKVVLSLGMDDI